LQYRCKILRACCPDLMVRWRSGEISRKVAPPLENCSIVRGRNQKRYSVIAIMLHYILELSHNASTLGKVIASFSHRSGLIEIVIASFSYRSSLIGIIISFSYRSKVTITVSLFTPSPGFSPSGVDLTGYAHLRAWDMGEVVLL
jgi:hypothetical protein